MSLVTYFLDLIASIKKETFISFKIYSDNKIWDLNWIYFGQNQEKFQTYCFRLTTSKTRILGVNNHIIFHKSIFNH